MAIPSADFPSDELAGDIRNAVNVLANTSVKRLEGESWKAYTVGDIIRVDISHKKEQ